MGKALGSMFVGIAATVVAWGPALADVKSGAKAWQAGDYARAVSEWQVAADQNDPAAQFDLGQAYRLGRGVPMDTAKAIEYYRRAAEQGHQPAQASLGLLLFQGGDRAGALPWIRKAADQGDPRAQYVLGTAYFNGDLVGRDYVKAYALMSRAKSSGLSQAASSLAQMDKYVPAAQRQQALILAGSMAGAGRTGERPGTAPVVTARAAADAISTTGTPPVAASTPAPRRPTAASGSWRVQFGAFGSPDAARRLWDGLKQRSAALDGRQPFFVASGSVTRLQAGPFASKGAADAACASLRGQDCFAIRP